MFFPVRLFILHVHAPSCSLFPDEAQFGTIKQKLRNSTTKKANTIPQQRHLNSYCSYWWGVCGWKVLWVCCSVASYKENFPIMKRLFRSTKEMVPCAGASVPGWTPWTIRFLSGFGHLHREGHCWIRKCCKQNKSAISTWDVLREM